MHGSILTVLVVQVQLEVEDDLLQISEVFARLCRTGWHIGCCLKNVVDLIILVKLLHIDHRGSLVRQRVDQEDFCLVIVNCDHKWKLGFFVALDLLQTPAFLIYSYSVPLDLVKSGPT